MPWARDEDQCRILSAERSVSSEASARQVFSAPGGSHRRSPRVGSLHVLYRRVAIGVLDSRRPSPDLPDLTHRRALLELAGGKPGGDIQGLDPGRLRKALPVPEQRPATLGGACSVDSVQRRLEFVRLDVANKTLDHGPASDPQQPYADLVADLGHPTAVALGIEDDVDQLLRGADLRSEKEEVGAHLGHAMTKAVVEEVAGYDDDSRNTVAGVRADVANNAYTREVVPSAALVGRIEKDDIDVGPELPLPKRPVMANGGEQFHIPTSAQGGGVAVASEGVVVDEGDSSPL